MSVRRVALILAVVALLAGGFAFLREKAAVLLVPDSSALAEKSAVTAQGIASAGTPLPSPPSAARDGRQQSSYVFAVLNHNPIEFYGRAVDQFGAPVAAAEVRGSILYNTGLKSGVTRAHTTTDAQGYFQFTELTGQDLGIGISKEDYESHFKHSSFSFSYFEADHKRHQPDRNNPVVFVLWKKRGAEPLVHYRRVWRFPLSAGPVKISLRTGEIDDANADIVVSISRMPLQMRYGQQGYAWDATVEVVDGGLIRAGPLDYYNLAPESGYEPQLKHVQEAQDLREAQMGRAKWTWQERLTDDFFISSHQGKNFAHVALEIWPNSDHQEGDNEALVEAEVWLNPNGSRNLEFDPNQVIPLPRQ